MSRVSDDTIGQFCAITGASARDAKRFLEKYKRLDAAMDAYYNNPNTFAKSSSVHGASTSKLNALFDKYKDADGDSIGIDGTIQLCEDLGVNPEDVVLLPIAFELKAPSLGVWEKSGWVDGWKNLHCDTIPLMQNALPRLRQRLSSDPQYFKQVYNFTFNFAKQEGQRSIGLETAQAFWQLLLPVGFKGGALSHVRPTDEDEDEEMPGPEEGFKEEYIQWWFDFVNEKGAKGVSKDTWQMVREFIRSIDANFEKYDPEASWPSQIDDFVEYAKGRLASS